MYRVHYLRQDWSAPYERDSPEPPELQHHPTGEVTIDCGTATFPEEFIEGCLPGTYIFTPYRPDTPGVDLPSAQWFAYPAETFAVVVGHPDAPPYERIAGDLL